MNIITSYVNPDTDGVVCMITLAYLIEYKYHILFTPCIYGKINEETRHILESVNYDENQIKCSLAENIDKCIIVDTHNRFQLDQTINLKRVIYILDHHDDGELTDFPFAKYNIKRCGAAASIVLDFYIQNKIINPKMLKLLQYAIISNTLNFIAPSTTEYDIKLYSKFDRMLTNKDIAKMFFSKDELLKKDIRVILNSDVKCFKIQDKKVGISQLEIYDLINKIDLECISKTISDLEVEYDYFIFNGIDIKNKISILCTRSLKIKKVLSSLFKHDFNENDIMYLERVVLRKTDLIPGLLGISL